MKTQLPEPTLVKLRAQGFSACTRFVDPVVLNKAMLVIRRRGEEWAESVLGRSLSRRSLIDRSVAFLVDGEQFTLVAADRAEDGLALAAIPGSGN